MFFDKIYGSWKKIQFEKYSFIIEDIINFLKSKISISTLKILDVGCGPMYFEEFLDEKIFLDNDELKMLNWRIISTDIKIPKNHLTGDFSFVISNGGALPFRNKYFDLILSFDSSHLFSTNDFHRVLKSDGLAVVSLPLNISGKFRKIKGLELVSEKKFYGRENEIFRFYKIKR